MCLAVLTWVNCPVSIPPPELSLPNGFHAFNEKSRASAATAYRQQISERKLAEGPAQLRVLVMMEVPAGSAHSWFTIPLSDAPPAAKQAPVRLE